MLDDENPSTRAELLRLTPSGDLLDLARSMRDMGVESLLFCSPSGRIQQVVTDRQIAHLAANPDPVPADASALPSTVLPSGDTEPARSEPTIPQQGAPAHADYGVRAARG